jgi:exoribonuclease R
MATKAKARKPRPKKPKDKQGYLPEMEPPSIAEIDRAADAYRECRDERMQLTETETELSAALLAVMHKHNLKNYTYGDPPFVCNVVELEKVKVRKQKAEKNGDGVDL